ncbi:hypothetical protein SAMN05428970_1491 [Agromyces sp. CF514]|nr:hypothetical protein SAMN05428970_1491 [Agromyces sp. CF514]
MKSRERSRSVVTLPTQRQVNAMTQPSDEWRLEESAFVDELSPTTSAIVVLGYN